MATKVKLAELSAADRQVLEAWLVAFDLDWEVGLLERRVRGLQRLPMGGALQLPALIEMVKVDLERQWQHGRQISLEIYLKSYPDLGGPDEVVADLILAEYLVRRQFGAAADLDDYV